MECCNYDDCHMRNDCVHYRNGETATGILFPKYVGPQGCIFFKKKEPHFEKGKWIDSSLDRE
jgi:hypothetical protein